MSMQRTKIMTMMIETLTSPTGAGSDLVDPRYVDIGHRQPDHRIEIADGDGGHIDLDHLVTEIETLINEAVEHDRETR